MLQGADRAGRNGKLAKAASTPIAKVIAINRNGGIVPVATVITASHDHIMIAVSPMSFAVREDMGTAVIPGRTRIFARANPESRNSGQTELDEIPDSRPARADQAPE